MRFSRINSFQTVNTKSFITLTKRKVEPSFWCHFKANGVVFKNMYNTHILKFPTCDSFRSDGRWVTYVFKLDSMLDRFTRLTVSCYNCYVIISLIRVCGLFAWQSVFSCTLIYCLKSEIGKLSR